MDKLATIAWQGMLVAFLIFVLLLGADVLFPQMFKTHVAWWLLPILFVVHVIPRLVALGVGVLLPRSRRRKT